MSRLNQLIAREVARINKRKRPKKAAKKKAPKRKAAKKKPAKKKAPRREARKKAAKRKKAASKTRYMTLQRSPTGLRWRFATHARYLSAAPKNRKKVTLA